MNPKAIALLVSGLCLCLGLEAAQRGPIELNEGISAAIAAQTGSGLGLIFGIVAGALLAGLGIILVALPRFMGAAMGFGFIIAAIEVLALILGIALIIGGGILAAFCISALIKRRKARKASLR